MSKPKILVIDDNPADVHLLQISLSQQNCEYEIEIAVDGDEAIRVVMQQTEENRVPCVIVLDMHLPKYDGLDVLREIRSTPNLDHVKVIITTVALRPEHQEQILQLQASYYPKPWGLSGYEQLALHVIDVCRNFESTYGIAARV